LLKLIRNRTLAGELIIISRPKIKLAGEELLQYDSLSISSGFIHNLWPLFGYIDRVEIKKIEFEDADFGFYGGTGDTDFISRAEKVAIDVHGFTIGKELSGTSENFVETEDIFLRMNDFNFDMGDGLHMLTIDTLLYSLKTTDIKVNGFRLLPYSLNEEENIFEVYVPEVYVKSKSITHFALKDSLHVSFLEFIKPSIKFFQKKQPRIIDFEVLENFDLYSLVSNKFIKL